MFKNKAKYRIKPTKFGLWLIFLTLFLLFAAQNTGNNLLYLVCSSVFTAILFGLTDIIILAIGFKAELVHPDTSLIGEQISILCKIAKNTFINRYYLRFEDTWLEKITKDSEGFLRKDITLLKRGRYEFKNLSVFVPSMLDIFYYQYVFPDIVIYAIDDFDTGTNKKFYKNSELKVNTQTYGRDGEFYSFETYQEGNDASHINWTVSARSNEEWVEIREKTNEEIKILDKYNEKLKSLREPFEKYEIHGKEYKDLSEASLKKDLNPMVFRLMLLLALLVCFGIYNIGYLQKSIPWLAAIFVIFAIKGKAVDIRLHKFIYFSTIFVAFYIIGKGFIANSPAKIVLLLEFSLLILLLQYITMVNLRNILAALTLVFMIFLGIAAMNVNSAFPVFFLPFLVFTSMLLTFLRVNLVSTDATVKNKFSANPKGITGTVFLLIIFTLLWIPFFYLIPRTKSYGIASNLAEERSEKGFSDSTLDLNSSGLLEDNLTVVMRIIPNEAQTVTPSILKRLRNKHIRGGSFSLYENGEWKKTRRGLYVRHLQNTAGEVVVDRKFENFKSLHNFDVILEGTDTPTAFIPEGTKVVTFHEYNIGVELDGSMFFLDKTSIFNKRYTVAMTINEEEHEDTQIDELINYDYYYNLMHYLSLSGISSNTIKLSQDLITKDSNTIDSRVQLVMDYLNNNYEYSTDQPQIPKEQDPIDYFLFESKSGTCQHFASSMVFILRGMGIPCRVVNGFMMGDWNDTGGFFTVRQSDAHAWVEVYYPKSGWIPYDPTPFDDKEKTSKLAEIWNKIVEIYEGYWFNYVYSFDERAQKLGNRNIIFKGIKNIGNFLKSPWFLGLLLSLEILYIIFHNSINALWKYTKNRSKWIPLPYYVWESKLKIKRQPNETPSEFHDRLFKEKAIDSITRDILYEVEELIDQYAFKKDSNKYTLSREIKTKLRKAYIV